MVFTWIRWWSAFCRLISKQPVVPWRLTFSSGTASSTRRTSRTCPNWSNCSTCPCTSSTDTEPTRLRAWSPPTSPTASDCWFLSTDSRFYIQHCHSPNSKIPMHFKRYSFFSICFLQTVSFTVTSISHFNWKEWMDIEWDLIFPLLIFPRLVADQISFAGKLDPVFLQRKRELATFRNRKSLVKDLKNEGNTVSPKLLNSLSTVSSFWSKLPLSLDSVIIFWNNEVKLIQ